MSALSANRHQTGSQAIVVGGGVIGVCCAYFLAKRGVRVTVLERDEIGKGASYGNAGIIAPGHAPINKPGRVKQALKSVLDPLSPLYLVPRPDPALASWLWGFARACTERHLEFCLRLLAPLGHLTRQLFQELVEHEKLECDYRPGGYYEAYLTEHGLQSAEREARLIQHHGYHPETLSGDAMRGREPALNDQVLGGVFYPEAATLNPYRFVLGLAERAQRYGATFRTGTDVVNVLTADSQVRGVQTSDGETIEADVVVLAMGAYSVPLIRKLGLRFPLQAAKGYHRDREPGEGKTPLLRHACMLGEKSVFCTPMGGFMRFAGTLEFSGVNHEIRRRRLEQLTNAAKRYLTGVRDVESRSEWCGLRPCMADGLPVVGPVARCPGLFIATGHAMLGLTLGPITGRLVAEYVLDGAPAMDITALRPERF
jgi:D-amino-acid dehydrogenase